MALQLGLQFHVGLAVHHEAHIEGGAPHVDADEPADVHLIL